MSATYNTLFKGARLDGLHRQLRFGPATTVAATWFTNKDTENNTTAQSNQVRLSGVDHVPAWNLRFEGQINYDLQQQLLQNDQIALTYNSPVLRRSISSSATSTPAPARWSATARSASRSPSRTSARSST